MKRSQVYHGLKRSKSLPLAGRLYFQLAHERATVRRERRKCRKYLEMYEQMGVSPDDLEAARALAESTQRVLIARSRKLARQQRAAADRLVKIAQRAGNDDVLTVWLRG